MNIIIIWVGLVLFCGCGAYEEKEYSPDKRFEPHEFDAYVEMFKADAKIQGQDLVIDNLIIEFGEIEDEDEDDGRVIAGTCLIGSGTPLITVNVDVWPNLNDIRKKALLYHEMGHCILLRDHVDPEDGLSFMNPMILATKVIQENEAYLLQELFTQEYYGSIFSLHSEEHRYD